MCRRPYKNKGQLAINLAVHFVYSRNQGIKLLANLTVNILGIMDHHLALGDVFAHVVYLRLKATDTLLDTPHPLI